MEKSRPRRIFIYPNQIEDVRVADERMCRFIPNQTYFRENPESRPFMLKWNGINKRIPLVKKTVMVAKFPKFPSHIMPAPAPHEILYILDCNFDLTATQCNV